MRKSESLKGIRYYIKDSDLRTQIDNIWNKAEKSFHPFQEGDTNQGTLHCNTVEENITQILIDSEKIDDFNDTELFILSAAACLHDIGKMRKSDLVSNNNKFWSQEKDHGKKGKFIIFEHYSDLGLERLQMIPIAEIVGFHSNGKIEELEKQFISIKHLQINIIRLAILFRLADILHTTSDRAPEIVSKMQFSDGKTPPKVKARQGILDWCIKDKKIVLCSTPTIEEENAVIEAFGMIEKDLEGIVPYLISYGFPEKVQLELNDSLIKFEYLRKTVNDHTFQGMAFYTEDEAVFFKGREKEIQDLLNNVFMNSVSLLIGESGAGKTSLVRAGLFPRLLLHQWKCIWVRPLEGPLINIKKNILLSVGAGSSPSNSSLRDIITIAADKCKPQTLLLVFDQFEDILKDTEGETYNEFYYALAGALTRPHVPNALYSNLKILIVFRDDAFVKIASKLLKSVTGSNRSLPLIGLQKLTRNGAKQAIIAGLERAQKEFQLESGEKPLIEIILDDLQKGSDRIFPPYLQIVVEALARKPNSNIPLITSEIYFNLSGTDAIISRYLIDRLIEFGPQQDLAKNILKSLTSSTGDKDQKTINELSDLTTIDIATIRMLLKKLIDLRMVRDLGNDTFEIIHDYLGKIIDKELISDEERDIKFLHEQLQSYYEQFQKHGAPILSTSFLANLYRYRRVIRIPEKYYELLILTCISETSLGWYWIKNLKTEKIRNILFKYVNHENPTIQRHSLKLIILDSITENQQLLHQLLIHDDKNFRQRIIDTLIHTVTHDHFQIFVNLLNDNDAEIRKIAVKLIEKIAIRDDLQIFVNLLNDNDVEIRKIAVKLIEKIAIQDDLQIFVNLLNDNDEEIRNIAIKQIESCNLYHVAKSGHISASSLDVSLQDSNVQELDNDVPMLIDSLLNADNETKRAIVLKLNTLVTHNDLPKLIELLDSRVSQIRRVAVKIMGKVATHHDLQMFIDFTNDEDEKIRIIALTVLSNIAVHDDIFLFTKFLSDQNYKIRNISNNAVKKLATHNDLQTFIEILKEGNSNVVQILKNLVTPQDIQIFIELLDDPDKYIRRTALMVLSKIVTHDDLPILTNLLNDPEREFRIVAIKTIGRLATYDDLPILTNLLNDPEWEFRKVVIETIGRLATHADLQIFINLLNDPEREFRIVAIETIGRLATHADLPILTNLLNDPEREFRKVVIETIGRLATYDDLQIFINLLDHFDYEIRNSAISLLIKLIKLDDVNNLLDNLALNAMGWTPSKQRAFTSLSLLDKKYYNPFPFEIEFGYDYEDRDLLSDFADLDSLSLDDIDLDDVDDYDNSYLDSLIIY